MNAANRPNAQPMRRYFIGFIITVLIVWALVAGFNRWFFNLAAAPENQAILQGNVGWERTYKPITFDLLRPQVAAFGASWVRDAFDYEQMNQFLREHPGYGTGFFNFAASGAQPYENLRFLESALDLGTLKTVILNLDSFSTHQQRPPTSYGFNEDVLRVDPQGQPNRFVQLHRLFATTLSGAAIASNISSVKLLRRAQAGEPKEQLLRNFDRHDYAPDAAALTQMQEQIFRMADSTSAASSVNEIQIDKQRVYLAIFDRAIARVCKQPALKVFAYFTPHSALAFNHDPWKDDLLARKIAMLEALHFAKTKGCAAQLHLFDFHYPNRVTLEGMGSTLPQGIAGQPRLAHYYRSDLHPRPTVGIEITKRMLGKGAVHSFEFGDELMSMGQAQAQEWLRQRFVRWHGLWSPSELAQIRGSLNKTY
jgi:hypothetical protein